MPWHLEDRGDQVCVVLDETGEPIDGGCHPTRAEAEAHLRALNVNVPDAHMGSAGTCACGGHGSDHPHVVVAALTGPMDAPYPVPAYPPRSWFYDKPEWFGTPTETMRAHLAAGGSQFDAPVLKLQVDDTGRVAGYFHMAGQCLVHNHAGCPKPSLTDHAAFHQSDLAVEDGEVIQVGIIANVGGHASEFAPISVAQAHYSDPNTAVVSVRAYDDEHGSFILGAVVPWATYQDVAKARLHPLSGDWRPMPDAWWTGHGIAPSYAAAVADGYDSIGPTFVNRAGLPLTRPLVAALEDSMADTAPVVVHQHFHDAPPGPQTAAMPMQAADPPPPPGAAPPDSGGGGDTVTREEFDALVAIVADMSDRVAACEEALGASQDAQMAAFEAAMLPLPATA